MLIGAEPHTGWLPEEIARDEGGYIVTGRDLSGYGLPHRRWHVGRIPLEMKTSMAGVFAVGDARHGSVKRVASAVGAGSIAVRSVHEYLSLMQRERPRPAGEQPITGEEGVGKERKLTRTIS